MNVLNLPRPSWMTEDLVLLDAAAGRVERLTSFPRDVLVVGSR